MPHESERGDKPVIEVRDRDREVYERELRDFLPERMIDIHTHVWLERLKPAGDREETRDSRVVSWPSRVARENPIEDHLECYRLLFPAKQVTPCIFAGLLSELSAEAENGYVRDSARRYGLPALLFALPRWSAEELERRVLEGGFAGIKVYLNLAPEYIPRREIRIFDFLPPHQLEAADRHGWLVVLHVPRDERLRDPVNLAQILEIERRWPQVQVVLAHVGRAYCNEDVGQAFKALRGTERLLFDISANSNDWVFERLLRAVGPKRVLFGSDLPILRMRARRICENGVYVNLVPRGLYGELSGDKNMREIEGPEAERLTFFMYEELLAFRRAAERCGLGRADLEDVFYNNAARTLRAAGFMGAEPASL
jgi:predicted TIM-barrel fold metal-dependent hydrolase